MPAKGKVKDITGVKFGHWIAIKYDEETSQKNNQTYWFVKCDCGCETIESKSLKTLRQIKIGGCKKVYYNSTSEEKICEKCQKIFYPKIQAKTRKYCYDCYPEGIYTNGAMERKLIKKWGVEYKGNQCEICGYNKCIAALDFHHKNPEEKDFNLSDRNIKLDWEKIKQELDKCILVCANCHREIHYKEGSDD